MGYLLAALGTGCNGDVEGVVLSRTAQHAPRVEDVHGYRAATTRDLRDGTDIGRAQIKGCVLGHGHGDVVGGLCSSVDHLKLVDAVAALIEVLEVEVDDLPRRSAARQATPEGETVALRVGVR